MSINGGSLVKKFLKVFIVILGVVFVGAQFFHPAKNNSNDQTKHLSTLFPLLDSVEAILRVACYDCHSNNTRYPWYAEIQPVGWWLNGHIQDGKHDLNFSEFGTYRIRKQYRRLQQIRELIEKNEMPLSSYTIVHKDAILTHSQKDLLFAWVQSTRDSIAAHTPADSLKQPPRKP
jgi:hypothetical protein